jgi:hypothetical protein
VGKNYTILLIGAVILFFSECKKGEDDPSVPLRTRKNRLVGEWRMTSGMAAYTISKVYNETYSFDGSKVRINVTLSGNPVVYLGNYLLNLKVSKNGTFQLNEIRSSSVLSAEGTWNFNTGVGEDKKKEDVIFFINKVSSGSTWNHLFNRTSANFVYKIKELRNKKLVIQSSGKIYTVESGDYIDFSTEYTFIQ